MNRIIRSAYGRVLMACAGTVGMALLAGCGVKDSVAPPDSKANAQIQGVVFAGRNYMPDATVKLYATQSTGVATNGVYVGSAKLLGTATTNGVGGWYMNGISCSSPDMLYATAEGGRPFVNGTNVDTGLPANSKSLMMVAIGDCSLLGNPATIVINEASTVAAIYALQPFISLSGTTVNVTSSSTNYAGSNGVGTTASAAGLKHAFQNAANMAPYDFGAFAQYTNGQEAGNGGLFPVQELNQLAYIQYLCTMGSDSTAGNYAYCDQLFSLATPPGGTAPTNSLAAMLNIARNPANNAADLYAFSRNAIPYLGQKYQITGYSITGNKITVTTSKGVPPTSTTANFYQLRLSGFGTSTFLNGATLNDPKPVSGTTNQFTAAYTHADVPQTAEAGVADLNQPNNAGVFVPELMVAPQDWSVAIYYPKGWGATSSAQGLAYPLFLAQDADDNVYVSNNNGSSSGISNLIGISHNGNLLWVTPSDTEHVNMTGIAVDSLGHVFSANNTTTVADSIIREYDATSGATIQDFSSTSLNLQGLAVDRANNLWFTSNNTTAPNIHQLAYGGGTTYTSTTFAVPPTTAMAPYQIVLDANQNVWAAAGTASTVMTNPQVYVFPNTGTASAPAYASGVKATSTITGSDGNGIAVDAAGNAYLATTGSSGSGVWKVTPTGTGAAMTLNATNLGANPAASNRNGAIDGKGSFWYVDNASGAKLYQFIPSTATSMGYYGCLPAATISQSNNISNSCGTPLSGKIDVSIDSTGSVWIPSASNGQVVEILSVAAPAWPLKASGKPGVMP